MTEQTGLAPPSAPPAPSPRGLRAMFRVRRAPRRQWPTALRTAASVAIPALVGWAYGDLSAGLTVSLGGFAALYGGGRPYVNRARLMGAVALAQAVAVALGIWAAGYPGAGLAVVTLIAVIATAVCNAFNVQPGAYQIALTCAAGTAMHAQAADPLQTGLLVLAGGVFAGLASLTGAIVDRFGPEREAVGAAAETVADYLHAVIRRHEQGRPAERDDDAHEQQQARQTDLDQARHQASVAMHHAWVVLVNQQPHWRRPPGGLLRLQEISRTLQLILASGMRRERPDPDAAERARRLGRQARRRGAPSSRSVISALPLGRPSAASLLRNTLRPQSRSLLVIIRMAVAAVAAGALGSALGLSHTYWAIAAAVLVLSQGLDQRRTVQRGLERTLGTAAGLALTSVALAIEPRGLLLIAFITVTNFVTQLLVTRNYAAAAAFITCSALLMSTGSGTADQTSALLRARGLDTAIGCTVAILVFVVLSKHAPAGWLPATLARTLDSAATAVDQLTPTAVTSPAGLAARRDLQRQVIRLNETYENGINGYPAQRAEAERRWPETVAVERLAYRVLAEGWRLEEVLGRTAALASRTHPSSQSPPPSTGLRLLADVIRGNGTVRVTGEVPSFLSRDVADLRRVLAP